MAESLDAPERGRKKVGVCFLSVLCAQCTFCFKGMHIYVFIYIYIRVIYFGTLHLKIGQPTPYSLREKRARFQSLFLEEHGLQLEFITSHEAPNF